MKLKKKINLLLEKKKFRVLLIILIFLFIIRLILPHLILHYANRALRNLKNYHGHIEDIDLAIYRGAYTIKKLYINKKDSATNEESAFFDASVIDLSIHWRALFKGTIAGELELKDPTLRFVKEKTEPKQIQKDSSDYKAMLEKFMPLRINRFEIVSGIIKYIDNKSKPRIDLSLNNVHVVAEDLSTEKKTSLLPSTVVASADVYGGHIDVNLKLDPFAKNPTFDLNADLKDVSLPRLNDFFKAYGKFDVNRGTLGLYMEGAAKDGRFVGYVKPLIKNLNVVGPEDKDKSLPKKLWEGIVGSIAVIFKNQKHDQLATKIPLEGSFKKSKANAWYAVLDILSNAFVQALQPSIDNEINIHSVSQKPKEEKGLFKNIFKSKEKKESKK